MRDFFTTEIEASKSDGDGTGDLAKDARNREATFFFSSAFIRDFGNLWIPDGVEFAIVFGDEEAV